MNRLLLRKAWRDIGRRRSQIVAVAVTVFLGIALFAANNDASRNLDASYREMYDRLDFADVWATGGPTDRIVATLGSDPAVTRVETRTRFDGPIRIGERELVGTVIGVPSDAVLNRLLITAGGDLPSGAGGAGGAGGEVAVVEQHAEREFGLTPGDTIAIHGTDGWHPLEVVGAAASAEYVWLAPSRQQIFTVPDEFAVVFVPEATARALAPDAPMQVLATVDGHDDATASRVVTELRSLGAADAYTRAEQASNTALQSDVSGFRQLGFLFPVLFLSVAGMAAFVLLSRLVRTERPQIGMLVANGTSARAVRWHYTTHALVAVSIGTLPGLVAGALVGRWVSGLYTGFLDIPITVTRFSAETIVVSLAFAAVVTLIAGGLPARAAARMQPAEAMRPPAPVAIHGRSLGERLLPRRAPDWMRMVVRNVTRSRRRFASTVVGVVLALVLVITSLGMIDTVVGVFDRQFTQVDRRDLVVTYEQPVDDATLASLTGRPDVAAAERFTETPAVLAAGGATSDSLLQVFPSGTVAHGFDQPLPADGLVLGSLARRQLDVAVGDPVELVLPAIGSGGTRISTTVAGFVDEPVPSVGYASIDAWDSFGLPAPDEAAVILVDPDQHRTVRDALQAEPGVTAVVDQQAAKVALEQLMGLTYLFIGLMVAFAVVMASALVYNMVSVSLAERAGEVATLRANGVGRRFVARTVSAEQLLTIAAGLVPGVLIGIVTARWFVTQFDTESFVFEFVLRGRSILIAVVIVLVASMAAELPGLRSLSRLDLATIVRERSE